MRPVIIVGVAALVMAVTIAATSLPDPNAPAVRWITVSITIIAAIVAILSGVFLYRIARYNKDREGAQNTARIYRDEVEAMKRRMDTQSDDMKTLTTQNIALQHEAMELKSRTDITSVLKLQQEMQKQSIIHDTAVTQTLASAIERGQGQYKEVMDTLKQTLDYLAKSARETADQSKENYKLMESVSGAIGKIAEKLVTMDLKIADVQESLEPTEPKPKRR